MADVRIYVKDAEGAAVVGATVKAKAIGSGNEPVYANGGSTLVAEVVEHSAASTGLVTLSLTANASLIPANSYYRISIKAPNERKERVLYIVVPAGAGPYDVEDTLHEPGTVDESALAAHRATIKTHDDVADTAPTAGQVLIWDGTNWTPGDTVATDIEAAALVTAHSALTTGVHGVGAGTVESVAGSQAKATAAQAAAEATAAAALGTHDADTSVHGIADTSLLETQAGAQTKADAAQAAAATDATTKVNVLRDRHGLYVADYGTDGDAVQDAMDAAVGLGGGQVILEPDFLQTYLTTAKVRTPSKVRLVCFKGKALIKLADGTNGIFDILGNDDTTNGNDRISIENVMVDGNRANNATHKGSGMTFRGGCQDLYLTDVEAFGLNTTDSTEGIGINIQGGDRIWLTRAFGHDNDRHGVACGATPKHMHWIACQGYDNGQEGIHTSTGEFVAYNGNIAYRNGSVGHAWTNAKYQACTGNVAYDNPINYQMFGGHKVAGVNYSFDAGDHHIELLATSDSISRVNLAGWVCDTSGEHGIICSKVHLINLSNMTIVGTAATFDAIHIQDLSTGGYPSGKLIVSDCDLEAGAGGKSINVATSGYDIISITDNITPQDITVAGTPSEIQVKDNLGSTLVRKLDERIAHRTTNATAITSGTTGATLTSDDTLKATLPASTYWEFEATVFLSAANTAMDAKFGFAVPLGATMKWATSAGLANEVASFGARSASAAVTMQPFLTESGSVIIGTAAASMAVKLSGRIAIDTTAGDVNLQVAQGTSDAGALQVLAGSSIRFRKLP